MSKIIKLSDVAEIISGIGHLPDIASGKSTKFLLDLFFFV